MDKFASWFGGKAGQEAHCEGAKIDLTTGENLSVGEKKFEVNLDTIRDKVYKEMAVAAEGVQGESKCGRSRFRSFGYLYLCLKLDEQLERVQKNPQFQTKLNEALAPPSLGVQVAKVET